MLTKSQYEELLKYCGDGAKYDGNLTEPLRFLIRKKYVILYYPVLSDGKISDTTICVITEIGKDALREFKEYVEQEHNNRAREEADKIEQNAKEIADRRKQFKRDIVVAIIGSAVGGIIGLAISHFSEIVGFLASLFHG